MFTKVDCRIALQSKRNERDSIFQELGLSSMDDIESNLRELETMGDEYSDDRERLSKTLKELRALNLQIEELENTVNENDIPYQENRLREKLGFFVCPEDIIKEMEEGNLDPEERKQLELLLKEVKQIIGHIQELQVSQRKKMFEELESLQNSKAKEIQSFQEEADINVIHDTGQRNLFEHIKMNVSSLKGKISNFIRNVREGNLKRRCDVMIKCCEIDVKFYQLIADTLEFNTRIVNTDQQRRVLEEGSGEIKENTSSSGSYTRRKNNMKCPEMKESYEESKASIIPAGADNVSEKQLHMLKSYTGSMLSEADELKKIVTEIEKLIREYKNIQGQDNTFKLLQNLCTEVNKCSERIMTTRYGISAVGKCQKLIALQKNAGLMLKENQFGLQKGLINNDVMTTQNCLQEILNVEFSEDTLSLQRPYLQYLTKLIGDFQEVNNKIKQIIENVNDEEWTYIHSELEKSKGDKIRQQQRYAPLYYAIELRDQMSGKTRNGYVKPVNKSTEQSIETLRKELDDFSSDKNFFSHILNVLEKLEAYDSLIANHGDSENLIKWRSNYDFKILDKSDAYFKELRVKMKAFQSESDSQGKKETLEILKDRWTKFPPIVTYLEKIVENSKVNGLEMEFTNYSSTTARIKQNWEKARLFVKGQQQNISKRISSMKKCCEEEGMSNCSSNSRQSDGRRPTCSEITMKLKELLDGNDGEADLGILLQHILPLEEAFERQEKKNLKEVLVKFIEIAKKESDPNVFPQIKRLLNEISNTEVKDEKSIVDMLYMDAEKSEMVDIIKDMNDRFEFLFLVYNKVANWRKKILPRDGDDMEIKSRTLAELNDFVFFLPDSLKELDSNVKNEYKLSSSDRNGFESKAVEVMESIFDFLLYPSNMIKRVRSTMSLPVNDTNLQTLKEVNLTDLQSSLTQSISLYKTTEPLRKTFKCEIDKLFKLKNDEQTRNFQDKVFDKINTLKRKFDENDFYNELYNLFREADNTFCKDIEDFNRRFELPVYQNKSYFTIYAKKYEWLVFFTSLQDLVTKDFGNSLSLRENSKRNVCELKFQYKTQLTEEIKKEVQDIRSNKIVVLRVHKKMNSNFIRYLEDLQIHFENFWLLKETFSRLLDLDRDCEDLKRNLEEHIESECDKSIPEDQWFGLEIGMISENQYFPCEKFVDLLTNIDAIGSCIHPVQDICANRIDEYARKVEKKYGRAKVVIISAILEGIHTDSDDIRNKYATRILTNYKVFKGWQNQLRAKRFPHKQKNEDILKDVKGDKLDNEQGKRLGDKCEEFFKCFHEKFDKGQNKFFKNRNDFMKYKSELASSVQDLDLLITDTKDINKVLLNMICNICAYWSLEDFFDHYSSSSCMDDNVEFFRLTPHIGQVVTILRLLNLDSAEGSTAFFEEGFLSNLLSYIPNLFSKRSASILSSEKVCNHICQVGTGEGKSLILAVINIVLALCGWEVDCVCYSEGLSVRDHKAFESLIMAFGVGDRIRYGTFKALAENFINRHGEVRKLVQDAILTPSVKDNHNSTSSLPNTRSSSRSKKTKGNRGVPTRRALILDEVDVFFEPETLGGTYNPTSALRHETFPPLFDYIWALGQQSLNTDMNMMDEVRKSAQFKACVDALPDLEGIIDEQVKQMIGDFQTFEAEPQDYELKDDKIKIKEQDQYVEDVIIGYKTTWLAYKLYHDNNKLSERAWQNYKFLSIACGAFSYAEIPKSYQIVLGVSGTVDSLPDQLKERLKEEYGVHKLTIIPSVYSKSQLTFDTSNFIIEKSSEFHCKLVDEIQKRQVDLRGGGTSVVRPVFVFFSSKDELDSFYQSNAFKTSPLDVHSKQLVFTADLNQDERDHMIKRACHSGMLTLATRDFGRGTDFVYEDKSINAAGGVHIIQTFVSEDISEEIQIKGRTARQGKSGSFSFVIEKEPLEQFNIDVSGTETDEIDNGLADNKRYSFIREKATATFSNLYPEKLKFLGEVQKGHQKALKMIEQVQESSDSNKFEIVKNFLDDFNKCSEYVGMGDTYRTVIAFDATGSMGPFIGKTKLTVQKFFERSHHILKENNIQASLELEFLAYKNYNASPDQILQSSGWCKKPAILQKWLHGIKAGYGAGREAIELPLSSVNRQLSEIKINQMILIGDRGPNTPDDVTLLRNHFSWEKNNKGKFKEETNTEIEVDKLKGQLPIHTFYLTETAKQEGFQKIADDTGGKCMKLDLNDEGAEMLTHLVTEQILESIGNSVGLTDELIEGYRKEYRKGYRQRQHL